MSLRVLTIVWDRYPEGGSKLLAMLALADWAGDDGGRLYPSVAGLAAKIRMSERQTKRLLEGLIDTHYLELITKTNKGGRAHSNRYRIRLETLSSCPIVRSESQTLGAVNSDILSINPDIAMSDEPLEPIKPSPPAPGSIGEAIQNQRIFLAQLKKTPADPEEITRHEELLADLVRKRDGNQLPLIGENQS